jgi:hypothetical protein
MYTKTKKMLCDAMIAKYTALIKDAEARLHIYMHASVGIGEHPQITEEIDNLIGQLVEAQDRLEVAHKLRQDSDYIETDINNNTI